MEWMAIIGNSIQYMEDHITEDITVDSVAKSVGVSSFYFQKGFAMLCGFTVSEYIRNRRLALAGNDLLIKSFAPLKIKISLEGGYLMDYKIVKKEAFTIIANAKTFPYEGAKELIPQFWQEHFQSGKGKVVCGWYGINIDLEMGQENFEYLIADPYNPQKEIPEEFVTRTIPAFDWAVFPCRGSMPTALQDVNTKIYTEWLPALKEYEFAAGYCVEYYDDPTKYEKGTQDENYYCEIWIPVKKKSISTFNN